MVEAAEALRDLEAILALPVVDGIFAGPSDLSLTRARGRYRFGDADQEDLMRIARCCAAALIIAEQQAALYDGLAAKLEGIKDLLHPT